MLKGLSHPQSQETKEFEEHIAGLKFIGALTRSISDKGSTQELASRAASALALTDAEKAKRDEANRIIKDCNDKQIELQKSINEHSERVKSFEDYKKKTIDNIDSYHARTKSELDERSKKIDDLEKQTSINHANMEKRHVDKDFELQNREKEVNRKLSDVLAREQKCDRHEASLSEREDKLQRHLDDLSRMRG